MSLTSQLAFDAASQSGSVRTKDDFGRLHISRAKIAHSSVDTYNVSEIPDAHKRLPHLASDASTVRIMRDADSLKTAAARYARVPLYLTHTTELEGIDKSRIIGTVGSNIDVALDESTQTVAVYADLCVWDADAITAIERGDIGQLSASYSFDLDPTHGAIDEKQFDAIMRVKTPNHVALVQRARGGPTLRIGDSAMSDVKFTQADVDAAVKSAVDAVKAQIASDAAKPAMTQADVDAAVKVANDSLRNELLTQANARHAAAVDTRVTLGDIALDSADEYYTRALDALKVERTGVVGTPNLAALYKLALRSKQTTNVASDSQAHGTVLGTVNKGGLKFNMPNIERAY